MECEALKVSTSVNENLIFFYTMGLQTFCGAGPDPLSWAGSRAAGGQTNGIRNHLNYFVIFIVYTQFTDVARGRGMETYDPNSTYTFSTSQKTHCLFFLKANIRSEFCVLFNTDSDVSCKNAGTDDPKA